MSKINVLIVDDSALVRQILSEFVRFDSRLELIHASSDPIFAMEKMKKTWPDVIVLDIEMPRMDGITFLKKIMKERPTPVVICSSLATTEADATMLAMEAGAVDIITKPQLGLKAFLEESRSNFLQVVKAAASSNITAINRKIKLNNRLPQTTATTQKTSTGSTITKRRGVIFTTTEKVVAIGTSTGGTIALEFILKSLNHNTPGIVIVQHMPEKFTATFAKRLDAVSELDVKEAEHNDKLRPGLALVAPGNKHMVLNRSGTNYYVETHSGAPVRRHRPSVDVLFQSVAEKAGKNAVGIIMTGMGDDGAAGLKAMHDNGAYTIAQDEKSCIVFGMPKEAIKKGGVDKIVPLSEIPNEILKIKVK